MRARYKPSRCVAYHVNDRNQAVTFYTQVLGYDIVNADSGNTELNASPIRLFIEEGPPLGPIMEIVVDDLETARIELLAHGCTEVRWEGRGKPCYLRDPFGICFNVWEDRNAFE